MHCPQIGWKAIILSLFKGKGTPTERGNYRGLKLIEHSLKVLERIIEVLIRDIVDIDAMQFGFRPGKGTTDAIFILRQLQEKYLAQGNWVSDQHKVDKETSDQ